MVHIVITMSGLGKRFLQAGFREPKFRLYVNQKPIFDWALASLQVFFENAAFVFLSPLSQEAFIQDRCRALGIKTFSIRTVHSPTSGQAATARIACTHLKAADPVMIYNIDTHIKPENVFSADIKPFYDGWLLLFEAEGTHWSFAEIDSDAKVIQVSEKVRISRYASAGLYYFRSAAVFNSIFDEHADEVLKTYGETYVAPFYNYLIQKGARVYSKVIPKDSIIPLGTPAEALAFDPHFFHRNDNRLVP